MKVVKMMEPAKFESVCRAGAEAFFEILGVADEHGLTSEQLINMTSVLAAGVLKTFAISFDEIRESVELAQRMWDTTPGEPREARFMLPIVTDRPVGEN